MTDDFTAERLRLLKAVFFSALSKQQLNLLKSLYGPDPLDRSRLLAIIEVLNVVSNKIVTELTEEYLDIDFESAFPPVLDALGIPPQVEDEEYLEYKEYLESEEYLDDEEGEIAPELNWIVRYP